MLARGFERLVVISATVAVIGCSGGGNKIENTGPHHNNKRSDSANDDSKKGNEAKPDLSKPITTVACVESPCMVHAIRGTYHQCLNAASGTCFQYGRTCTPKDRCMFDIDKGSYRKCIKTGEGSCEKFGSACKPAGNCMLDTGDNRHRTCDRVVAGVCQAYGELCEPPG